MATLRMDLPAFIGKLLEEQDGDVLREDVPVLAERLQATERRRCELKAGLEARQHQRRPAWRDLERRMRRSLSDWRSLLSGDVAYARQGFRELLSSPIRFTPFVEDGRRGLRFEGRVGLEDSKGERWRE